MGCCHASRFSYTSPDAELTLPEAASGALPLPETALGALPYTERIESPTEDAHDMLDLPDETIMCILAALPYIDLAVIVRVCRNWHALRSAVPFSVIREAEDELQDSTL